MTDFLRDLALAHQKHEGYFPPCSRYPNGSLSYRNRNPGNLRLTTYQSRAYRATMGEGDFARFPTYEAGFQALLDDLRAKLTGYSSHIDYSNRPTFLDYVKVYAPTEDGNDPRGYAQALLNDLSQYGIRLSTPLSDLAKLITQPQKSKTLSVLLRLAARLPEPVRSRLLKRLTS